jgi:tRNA modification GTPase
MMEHDTIAALSTPLGRGGIAVIRISGDETLPVLSQLVESLPRRLKSRKVYHSFIHKAGKRIDECLVTYFQGPNSYTGEDVAEISVHSSPFIVEAVLELIFRYNTRQALPGEFTFRAFKNGKMDLIQAESVNELINANSRFHALMKFDNLEGKLSDLVAKLRSHLLELGVRVESIIEFQEDQYLEHIEISTEVKQAVETIQRVLGHAKFNDVLDKGINIVIAGKVNVGKSSLFNYLLMEERSIISSIPGTTRDFIREKVYIDGFPFEITDVAGINSATDDHIETIGIARSFEKIEKSDAIIFLLDASRPLEDTDIQIYDSICRKERLILVNKTDSAHPDHIGAIRDFFKRRGEEWFEISLKDDVNVETVPFFLKRMVKEIESQAADLSINQRQKNLLERLVEALDTVNRMVEAGTSEVELIAEHIRVSMDAIGQLTGHISTDDILNRIFANFCVGK